MPMRLPSLSLLLVCLLPAAAGPLHADALAQALALSDVSLVVEEDGRQVIARNPDRPMVPASTMKLITALAALERWGPGHRFETRFYSSADGRLWVEGGADPYLVSEELDRVVAGLRRAGVTAVSGIDLDDGLFVDGERIPGRSASSNPYDAPVTALAANFNTIHVVVSGNRVDSGEAQTPLTATARRMGLQLGNGRHRVNLKTRANALAHCGELLQSKLARAGINVAGDIDVGPRPAAARLVYTHRNSRTLEAVVASMLQYSTNFVANSLFLALGERNGRSSMAAAQRAVEDWASRSFGWRDFRIEDGAGLSRGNRISGRQMLDVLEALAPYRHLLDEQDDNPAVRAKTGTLRGVSTYAGYVRRRGDWAPFSLMINEPVDYGFRLRVASALAGAATLTSY